MRVAAHRALHRSGPVSRANAHLLAGRPSSQTFEERARRRACDWKQHSHALPDEARVSAPYIRDGNPVGCYPYCLPPALSACNLLPEVRAEALERFAADHIAWHAAIDGRPTNHLLSSQI